MCETVQHFPAAADFLDGQPVDLLIEEKSGLLAFFYIDIIFYVILGNRHLGVKAIADKIIDPLHSFEVTVFAVASFINAADMHTILLENVGHERDNLLFHAVHAQRGYLVFAYDATGNDESEGSGVGGIPQGVIDLDRAISFVADSGNFPSLPIVLFGHSWGGYSACSVLTYHPEVKAVIECSGCNRSSDLFEAGGKEQAGDVIYTMMPFVRLHERIKFGKYASNTAMDGFAASQAAVMIVHSADDGVVPISYGYDVYYKKYQDDSRFTFIRLEDRGHNYVYDDTAYIDELNAAFADWLKTLDYDYQAAENRDRFAADKAAYLHGHLDREKWSNMLDEELFDRFLRFYNEHITP